MVSRRRENNENLMYSSKGDALSTRSDLEILYQSLLDDKTLRRIKMTNINEDKSLVKMQNLFNKEERSLRAKISIERQAIYRNVSKKSKIRSLQQEDSLLRGTNAKEKTRLGKRSESRANRKSHLDNSSHLPDDESESDVTASNEKNKKAFYVPPFLPPLYRQVDTFPQMRSRSQLNRNAVTVDELYNCSYLRLSQKQMGGRMKTSDIAPQIKVDLPNTNSLN